MLEYNRKKIVPILEPCNLNRSTLDALEMLSKRNIPFIFIVNPKVGALKGSPRKLRDFISPWVKRYKNIILGYIIDSNSKESYIHNFIKYYKDYKVAIIHRHERDKKVQLTDFMKSSTNIIYNIFLDPYSEYYKSFPKKTRVMLLDSFRRAKKNSQYPSSESFSDLFLKYRGTFAGFGDFQTCGDVFYEKGRGGPPHAVVIHFTYLDKDRISINHFISDDTEGCQNISTKYFQALEKLASFKLPIESIPSSYTQGLKSLISNLKEDKKFHGHGYAKRQGIKHHIELILNLI